MSSSTQPEASGVKGTDSGIQNFLVSFGPGLLWAGSAIGVSHLVQSTRAGATAGFALTGVIIFALVLKYPFFEFGPRYAAATGESLVEGYRRIGRWALWLYLLIMLSTVVFTNAAILLFTEALFQYALGTSFSPTLASAVIYAGCLLLLWVGHYKALDLAIKVVVLVLALSTLVAASLILPQADFSDLSLLPLAPSGGTVTLAFMIALAGWMPVGIEAATLSSLWTLAKDKSTNVRTSVSTARLDFNIAYVGTGVLAFAFLILGAVVMYGSGEEFSPSPAGFSTQLIALYESTLGGWAGPIVVTAAVTAMFSTTLTVMDGYPRAIDRAIKVIKTDDPDQTANADISEPYWIALIGIGVLMTVFLHLFVSSLTQMIDFVTIISFMTGPILGYLNLKAVTSPNVPKEHQPGKAMVAFSYFGLVSMVVVAIIFLVSRVG